MRGERTRRDARLLHVDVSVSDRTADRIEVPESRRSSRPSMRRTKRSCSLSRFPERSSPDGPIFMEGPSTDFREMVSAPVPHARPQGPAPFPLLGCSRRGTAVYTVNSRLLHDGYTEGLLNEQPPASSAGKDPPIGRACGTATPNDAASRVDFKRMLSGRGTHPDRGATQALFLSPEIPSALLQEGTENIGVAVG